MTGSVVRTFNTVWFDGKRLLQSRLLSVAVVAFLVGTIFLGMANQLLAAARVRLGEREVARYALSHAVIFVSSSCEASRQLEPTLAWFRMEPVL